MRLLLVILLCFVPTSYAGNYALYNFSNADMTASKNSQEIVPIASITKLFTAALILEENLNLYEKVKVQGKNKGRFPIGSMVTRIELLKAMLIASDNRAADSLAYSYPGGYQQFIKDVNVMISHRNLKNTIIEDASGVDAGNLSTAEDLVNFVYSLRKHQLIIDFSSSAKDRIEIDIKKKHIFLPITNTNPDISKYNNILISKTGFTNKAGRCLVMLVTYQNTTYAVAILGEKTPKTRSKVVNNLMKLM